MKFTTLLLLAAAGGLSVNAQATEAARSAQTVLKAGTEPSVKGGSAYFTGSVRIDPLLPATDWALYVAGRVTFEPGARTAWHVHPTGQQFIVISGMGWTQQWGGPVVEVRAGDVVSCPPGVKHWHGASPSTAMTHIALTGTVAGKNVEWLEKVSDEQYRK